jgi:dipeptidyl aminopeptidase/acylaminoacyl peptidase
MPARRHPTWFLIRLGGLAAFGVAGALAISVGALAATPTRGWTVEDIAAAPEVLSVDISADGRTAMYIVRRGDLKRNAKVSTLHRVDLASGEDRTITTSPWLSHIQAIPGSDGWSLLADLGEGAQLYRLDPAGALTPILVNRAVDAVGSPDEGPQAMGVSDYGWSPDGKSFWYVRRNETAGDDRVIDPLYSPVTSPFGANPIELHVRLSTGEDVRIDTGAAITGGFYRVDWELGAQALSFWRYTDDRSALQQKRWSSSTRAVEVVDKRSQNYAPLGEAVGPQGGVLTAKGLGSDRRLIETLKDGRVIDHGPTTLILGHPRAPGSWAAPTGEVVLVGARTAGASQNSLIRVSRKQSVEVVPAKGSLTNCAVNAAFSAGVCVQQSMASPPVLVRFDPRSGGVTLVAKIAPDYDVIAPLTVKSRTWANRNGYMAGGFVIYPRGYVAGRRYPAILVNHGSDADDTFVNPAFQWEYPIQAWAERGYVVVAINVPSTVLSATMGEAMREYAEHAGARPIAERQDLIWVNSAFANEDAIKALAAEGLVDPDHVGIAGYSYGSQMVNVTMTQTKLFRAASSGDGGFLEPSSYSSMGEVYRWIFGGSPYDPAFLPNYQRLSPGLRASEASGPILQQVAAGGRAQIDLHDALRRAGVPSELVYYPDESHLFHQPRHRVAAMNENLDWFDFWLLGKEDPDPAKAEQYARWRHMREEARQ